MSDGGASGGPEARGGRAAERLVEGRVRAALAPPESPSPVTGEPDDAVIVRANVSWVSPTRDDGPARDGETDLVIVDPASGLLLAIEVKAGEVRRDAAGYWFAGDRALRESPFHQAETGARVLTAKIRADPRWIGEPPRPVHAVAFPDTDMALLGGRPRDLGPDAPAAIVLDRGDLADAEATRRALARVERFWLGDGARDRPLGRERAAMVDDILSPVVALRPLLRTRLDEGEAELLAPTARQLAVLKTLRHERRAAIVGGAGSGKTILAAAKARTLAGEGFNVLLVCFNQPLARALADDPAAAPFIASGRLTVTTFHELCRRLGAEAGVLPPQPNPPGRDWFERALPAALEAAIPAVGGRWQAVVVDEGQDFEESWLLSLDLLLSDPGQDVFYLFHDPAQALFRPDVCATMRLHEYPLEDNCRNARPIHSFAYRWYTGSVASEPLREDGLAPECIEAADETALLEAVRETLHRLVHVERVARERIAVLTGVALEHSVVWRQHRFKGDLTLWNGGVDRVGHSLGLAADVVPHQPPHVIACDSIRRFKGLEADAVVLVELRPDDERLERLLYVGATRAKHHLVVIASPTVIDRVG